MTHMQIRAVLNSARAIGDTFAIRARSTNANGMYNVLCVCLLACLFIFTFTSSFSAVWFDTTTAKLSQAKPRQDKINDIDGICYIHNEHHFSTHLMLLWFVFSSFLSLSLFLPHNRPMNCASLFFLAIYLLASCPFDVQVKIIRRRKNSSWHNTKRIICRSMTRNYYWVLFNPRRTLEWSLNRCYFIFYDIVESKSE